jgi:hypothetical protein
VRELFPEGIPEPEPDDSEERRRIVLSWPSWPFPDIPREDYEALTPEQKAEFDATFARLVREARDLQCKKQRSLLRLVVDNTKEMNHG